MISPIYSYQNPCIIFCSIENGTSHLVLSKKFAWCQAAEQISMTSWLDIKQCQMSCPNIVRKIAFSAKVTKSTFLIPLLWSTPLLLTCMYEPPYRLSILLVNMSDWPTFKKLTIRLSFHPAGVRLIFLPKNHRRHFFKKEKEKKFLTLMSVCLQWKRRFQLQLLKLVLGEGEVAYFECLTFQRVCHNQN